MTDKVLCFEIAPDDVVGCVECMRGPRYKSYSESGDYRRGEAVLVDMDASPYGDGQAHYMCNEHLKQFFGSDGISRHDTYKTAIPQT